MCYNLKIKKSVKNIYHIALREAAVVSGAAILMSVK
jgi:hypothetical protein